MSPIDLAKRTEPIKEIAVQLFFTAETPLDLSPLDGLVDLPDVARRCLAGANTVEAMPFVLSARGDYEHDLNAAFRGMRSTRSRAENSWRTYAYQVVLAAEFVTGACGRRSLFDATFDDLNSYRKVRRSERMPEVSGLTWNVQVAALEKLFRIAQDLGIVDRLPFQYREEHVVVNRRREIRDVNTLYEHVSIEDIVRCVSIEEYEFFREVGLLGMEPDGAGRTEGFSARNEERDAALAELLVTTGMRITECLVLFREELPTTEYRSDIKTSDVELKRGMTKREKSRSIMVSHRVMSEFVEPYYLTHRANAVHKAREKGTYDKVASKMVALSAIGDTVTLSCPSGVQRRKLNLLKPADRRRIYRCVGGDGIAHEPAVLWCGEDGLALSSDAVRMAFKRACDRCNENDGALKRFKRKMRITPHTLRHTYAVAHLSQLIREAGLSIRRDLAGKGSDADNENYRRVLMDPVNELRKRLGHSSVETTYKYLTYLDEAKATAFAAVEAWDRRLSGDRGSEGRHVRG